MRTKTGQYFEIGVRYKKTQEDGTQKKVTEKYVVDALSFTEAEERITEEMKAYISGDFAIRSEVLATYSEIVFSDEAEDDKWFKSKVQFITLDENTGKEMRTNANYLVQAGTINGALRHIAEAFDGTMLDYTVVSVSQTKVLDVFEYKTMDKEGVDG